MFLRALMFLNVLCVGFVFSDDVEKVRGQSNNMVMYECMRVECVFELCR